MISKYLPTHTVDEIFEQHFGFKIAYAANIVDQAIDAYEKIRPRNTADQVKTLEDQMIHFIREETGCGQSEIKRSLIMNYFNIQATINELRRRPPCLGR